MANSKKIEPIDVLKVLLRLQSSDEDSGDVITNLKAQKLLYYIQGEYLAKTGKPLFDDDFSAWQHGPVIQSLYHDLKRFGNNQIELGDDIDLGKFSDMQLGVIIDAYKTYGQFSAWKLRDMTHQETPWKKTKIGDLIPKDSIRDFFISAKRIGSVYA